MAIDEESVNSEIRYITIELMKIAAQKGTTFEETARDFLKNATFLKRLIEISESTDQMSRVLLSQIRMQKEENEERNFEINKTDKNNKKTIKKQK